jgi:hypothetical protein
MPTSASGRATSRTQCRTRFNLTLLVTLAATLAATNFHDFLLKASVWNAIYVIGAALCLLWLGRAGVKAYNNRNLGSIDTIIARIKPPSPSGTSPEMLRFAWSADLAKKVGEALLRTPLTPNQPKITPRKMHPHLGGASDTRRMARALSSASVWTRQVTGMQS